MPTFSATNRRHLLSKIEATHFDVLVVGGGITGAGIALDATLRGLQVALVEKSDFASGTSSRSTKLIHGGLRYLKQLEFGLVKEVGSERQIVHNLAPHLVISEKMLLPLFEKRGLGYVLTALGLTIYDWLAGVKRKDHRKMLTRLQTTHAEPLLNEAGVKGGALYAEYRTDDARLTLEIVKKAVEKGASAASYLHVIAWKYNNGKVCGARIRDEMTGNVLDVNADVCINATGPWVDDLREIDASRNGKHLFLTKGVHIVVARAKLPIKQAIYFAAGDGRMIFAIPRGETTYVGTTDTPFNGEKDHVIADLDDANYLLNAVNATFKNTSLSLTDIQSSWAGLRPLIFEEGKSASDLSRKDEIFISPSGLISIAGGKLTGYRKMAERVVQEAMKKHFSAKQLRANSTSAMPLTPQPFKSFADVIHYEDELKKKFKALGLPASEATNLIQLYGRQADQILGLFEQSQEGDPFENLVLAQLEFSIAHEMTLTLCDFFVRRTGWIYFRVDLVKQYMHRCAERMGNQLRWEEGTKRKEIDTLVIHLKEITHIADPVISR